jgi:serine/threonine protein kinase
LIEPIKYIFKIETCAAMSPASIPAATMTVRGFNTPGASGDEDSDYCSGFSTPRAPAVKITNGSSSNLKKLVSNKSCEMVRSDSNRSNASQPISGISMIHKELSKLNIENAKARTMSFVNSINGRAKKHSGSSNSSGTSTPVDSGDETTYEIDLTKEGDYSFCESKELGNHMSTGPIPVIKRKMTADDFEPLRCLGKGAFGTVHLVKEKATGRLFAQKQFKKASLILHKKQIEQTMTERSILENIGRNPFIVKLYNAFHDREKLYLILEYAQGGELFTHMVTERFFNQDQAAFYMAELLLALDYLHRKLGIVYRDLKPENCLLDADGHLLLTDFGLSKVAVDAESCDTMAGTIEYMAPEIVQGKKYGAAVDFWSLGALGFDLLSGAPPFKGNNKNTVMQNIVHGKLKMPYHFSTEAKDLLTRLLRKEPKKRLGYGPHDMKTIKAHRFFRNIDWKKLEKRDMEPPIVPFITDPEMAENFSTDFTELPLSPVVTRGNWGSREDLSPADPFGGFSYAATPSMFDGFLGHRKSMDDRESIAEDKPVQIAQDEDYTRVRAGSISSMISL